MNQTKHNYPDPEINIETKAFWDAANEEKLLLKSCRSCGKFHYYPRAHCPYCLSDDLEWIEASGKGSIYTFSVMRQATNPYIIAYVSLEEGVRMLTNIVDCDPGAIQVEQPVEVVFSRTKSGHSLPVFRPT